MICPFTVSPYSGGLIGATGSSIVIDRTKMYEETMKVRRTKIFNCEMTLSAWIPLNSFDCIKLNSSITQFEFISIFPFQVALGLAVVFGLIFMQLSLHDGLGRENDIYFLDPLLDSSRPIHSRYQPLTKNIKWSETDIRSLKWDFAHPNLESGVDHWLE